MRLNDGGFVAMLDATIFIIVIMLAAGMTIGLYADDIDDDRDTSGILEDLLSSEFRLSDFSGMDDSPILMSDAIALWMLNGDSGQVSYITEVLDSFSRGRPYLLELTYVPLEGENIVQSIGSGSKDMIAGYMMAVPVTTGGSITAELTLFTS